MFYRLSYKASHSYQNIINDQYDRLKFEQLIREFEYVSGMIMFEEYAEGKILMLVAIPNYPNHLKLIEEQLIYFFDAFFLKEDFEFKRINFQSLKRDDFFDALIVATHKYNLNDMIFHFYEKYYFETDASTQAKAYCIPSDQADFIKVFEEEEKKTIKELDEYFSTLNANAQKIFVIHEPNDYKSEVWFQYLSLKYHQTQTFDPITQYNTNINYDTSLTDLINLNSKTFKLLLIGNQWVISLPEQLMVNNDYLDILKHSLFPTIISSINLGQIIIYTRSSRPLKDYFVVDNVYEIWSNNKNTRFTLDMSL